MLIEEEMELFKNKYLQHPISYLTEENIDKLEQHCKKTIHYATRRMLEEHQVTLELIQRYKELKAENEEIKRDYINPQKARISYFDTKRNSQVVIEGFISKNKLKEIMYPTPTNPIPLEVQMSNIYRKIIKLLEE